MYEMRINKTVSCFLIILFLINVVFLPNDTFFLKKASFIMVMLLNVVVCERIKGDLIFVYFYGLLFPTLIIAQSILWTGKIAESVLGGFTGYLLLLYFVIINYDIDFEKILVRCLLFLAYFMVVMAILDFVGLVPTLKNPILLWLHNSSNAKIGRGDSHMLGIIYFMQASPMLLVAIPYCIRKKNFINALVVVFALILSGTRANMFMAIITLLGCMICHYRSFEQRLLCCIVCLVALVFVCIKTDMISYIKYIFEFKKSNDMIRNLTLDSLIKTWKNNPVSIYVGNGYAASFYNSGRGEVVSNAELSYWLMLWRLGLIGFFVFMGMFLLPLIKIIKKDIMLAIAYIAYLIVAYTNPLLYTSTGVTVLLYIYWKTQNDCEKYCKDESEQKNIASLSVCLTDQS